MSRVRVKICGITSREDAWAAVDAGADALGFVLAGGPRHATPETVRGICRGLPPHITRVGVFVDESAAEVLSVMESCGLDRAQLHGVEGPDVLAALAGRAYKAFRLGTGGRCIPDMKAYDSDGWILLDALVDGVAGGTGRTCDWDAARSIARSRSVILAGGLDPENVERAIGLVGPCGVDVSSGVEKSPGRKDPVRIREFIDAVFRTVTLVR